ncbi:hypothetical protein [Bacillus toyonensis]|uniref:hypothetical protein n=1 Tax=Bacillus toyonensis TaxID=155322 RepID=UPI000BEB9AE3|nr:hypothetical protein [Bacillus toyonensis]PEA32949.1 hypothetical protein COO13_11720 [Bacillus toyonensis]
MEKQYESLLEKLLLFYPYLKKGHTVEKLHNYIKKFHDFNSIYQEVKNKNPDDESRHLVAKTLINGLQQNEINESDLDELLFLLLEDSLFNSYLFKLQDVTCNLKNDKNLLSSWKTPKNHQILSNVDKKHLGDFVICGYRKEEDNGTIESLRLLLLDSKRIKVRSKNSDTKEIAFPTFVEIDFRRSLLHIRLRDVDNIVNESQEFSTMSGRIKNTIKFLDAFQPEIHYKTFNNFRKSLFELEEHLLKDKRELAQDKLYTFSDEIDSFTNLVCAKFSPPDAEITPEQHIANSVLSIISTTINTSELGDIFGIKFRNSKNDSDKKYAEITIKDKGYKCISTNNLYWLNLPVLQNKKSIESLQIVKILDNGTVIANLEFSLETANVKIHQKGNEEISGDYKATQEKYDDFINFILPFIK